MTKQTFQDHLRTTIDANFERQVDMLAKLVQCPSDNPPGDCAPHAELTAQWLEDLGFEVERHSVDPEATRAAGMRSVTNLIVRETFGPGPTIAMNAHGDVVPPGGGWTTDPYGAEIRDGWMYGRGAAVSKSDFTTYTYALLALKALRDQGTALNGSVELHFTYDEETGGLVGPGWILEQKLSAPDYVISAAFTHHVVVAHNGCLHVEIVIKGRSAHAARPDTGVDAIEAAVPVLAALYAYRDGLSQRVSQTDGIGSPTLVVGLIEGGINTNVVADTVTLRIDRRIIPEEVPEQVEAELAAAVREAAGRLPGISVDTRRILLARPFKPTAASTAFAQLMCEQASLVMGKPVTPIGIPLYTDARLYSEAGIPTVMFGAGPVDLLAANGHRADERVPLDELRKATRAVANTLLELLSRP
ncbi:M20/M25/M40 family metallo-hydrolase [Castellaniella sp. GW247-6E4]|uniref:M20/M25/M40 family metallo-hydrolase n=1 Tax=Castellaniella sp. GW247-6E4 TaxID=3140380 RepID=UPI0033149689